LSRLERVKLPRESNDASAPDADDLDRDGDVLSHVGTLIGRDIVGRLSPSQREQLGVLLANEIHKAAKVLLD
jgi:hypothetical protein